MTIRPAVLGLRGLIAQALRDGDSAAAALAYAERAFALRPQTRVDRFIRCFDMQAQIGRVERGAGKP